MINDLRCILLYDWDPHDVAKRLDAYGDAALHRYDTYLSPLLDLIQSGADEDAIMAYLADREAESMCFPSLGRERLRRVARKILSLKASSSSDAESP